MKAILPLLILLGAAQVVRQTNAAAAVNTVTITADFLNALAAEARAFQMLRLEIARQAFKAALADRAVELAQEDVAWLGALAQLAEQQFLVGKAGQSDVIKAQIDRAKRTEQIRTESERRDHERVALNRLLNRDFDASWPRFELPTLAEPVEFSPRLVDLSLKFEPGLKVLQREVEQAAALAEVTRLKRLPEFGVGIESRAFTGNGEFRQGMVFFNVNLPFWNLDKYRADHARDTAKMRAAEASLVDHRLQAAKEVHELITAVAAARREALLYGDQVIPRAELALASARTAWEAERGIFRDVLESRRMLIESRQMFARAVAEQYTMLSQLALSCGTADFEALKKQQEKPVDPSAKP